MIETLEVSANQPAGVELQQPLVSVVLPTFNRGDTIKASIDSVLCQSYKKLELIVVDDGSTDNTSSVLAGYDDSRVHLIRFRENRGANAARNAGILAGSGEYVAFQDSDDEWDSRKLQIQISGCLKHEAKVAFCSFRRCHNAVTQVIPKRGYRIAHGHRNLALQVLRGSFISCQTLVIQRQFLIDVGMFDETLPRLQDWELGIRMAFKTPFLFCPESLVTAQASENSISGNTNALVEAANLIYEKHLERFQSDPIAGAILFFNIAMNPAVIRQPKLSITLAMKGARAGGFACALTALAVMARRR